MGLLRFGSDNQIYGPPDISAQSFMIIPIARSTNYPLSMIYWVVHDGSWCHAYMWFDHAHRHATKLVSVGTDAWIEVLDPTKPMVQCPLQDQLRHPVPMPEHATLTERFPDGGPKSGVCEVKRWMDLPGDLEMEDVDRALGVTTVGPMIHIQDQHD